MSPRPHTTHITGLSTSTNKYPAIQLVRPFIQSAVNFPSSLPIYSSAKLGWSGTVTIRLRKGQPSAMQISRSPCQPITTCHHQYVRQSSQRVNNKENTAEQDSSDIESKTVTLIPSRVMKKTMCLLQVNAPNVKPSEVH